MSKSFSSNISTLSVVCIGALLVATVEGAIFYYYYKKTNDELKHMQSKRNDERSGRIVAQQKLRNIISQENSLTGYRLDPIGYVESPYNERRGTPRQPMLVPAAHGRIRFDKKKIQAEHFQEIKEFSHVWVVFMFHENTNTDCTSVAKIKPPRLFGKKVGCLSTRSPHRPNAIGLSVCEVIGVTNDSIELCCIDMMDGTPVLDIKPYLPYDIIPTPKLTTTFTSPLVCTSTGHLNIECNDELSTGLRVPDWISDCEPLKPVLYSMEANQTLIDMSKGVNGKAFKYCKSLAHARSFIIQVLSQDIRGLNQGRGSGTHIPLDILLALIEKNKHQMDAAALDYSNVVALHEADVMEYINTQGLNDKHVVYICNLDIMHIEFITTDNTIIVLRIKHNNGNVGTV